MADRLLTAKKSARPSTMQKMISTAIQTRRAIAERRRLAIAAATLGCIGFTAVLAWSGVTAFERHSQPVALAAQRPVPQPPAHLLGQRPAPAVFIDLELADDEVAVPRSAKRIKPLGLGLSNSGSASNSESTATKLRVFEQVNPAIKRDRAGKVIMVGGKPWTGDVFDHRPIRPVRTQTMKTTAYSPDERSCGKWADGITASGKSVWMNGGRLAAADKKVPYGTILTIPGYNDGKPVQVWDRGGKIKGNRLDLLYPTHEIARRWGVQDLRVVFWQFVKTD